LENTKIESKIVYSIGFIVIYIGLFFHYIGFGYGDLLYSMSEFFNPTLEYIFISLGLGIILYEIYSSKAIIKFYKQLFINRKSFLYLALVLFGIIIFGILPLLPGTWMFYLMHLGILFFCIYLSIKYSYLYITTCILVLIETIEKTLWMINGNTNDFGFMILFFLVVTVNVIVLVDGIVKLIKRKNSIFSFIYLLINGLVVVTLIFVNKMLHFGNLVAKDQYFFIWILPIFLMVLGIVLLTKKIKVKKSLNSKQII